MSKEESKQEALSKITQTMAALAKLKPVWNDKNISSTSKMGLLCSLVILIFLKYACETWTLRVELQKRILSMEMRCYRRLMGISHTLNVTNKEVQQKISHAIGPHDDCHKVQTKVVRTHHLAKTILQGTL